MRKVSAGSEYTPLIAGVDHIACGVTGTSSGPADLRSDLPHSGVLGSNSATSTGASMSEMPNKSLPGAFPTHDEDFANPYLSSHLDPRVDSYPRANRTPHREAPSPATARPSTAQNADSVPRRSEQGTAAVTHMPVENKTPKAGVAPSSTPSDTTSEASHRGILPDMMGALGLGSHRKEHVTDTAGAAATDPTDHSHFGANHQGTSTVSGVDSHSTPEQAQGPLSHHNEKSTLTTAYPSLTFAPVTLPPAENIQTGSTTDYSATRSTADEVGSGQATIGQTSTYGSYPIGGGRNDSSAGHAAENSLVGQDAAIGLGVGVTAATAASAVGQDDRVGNQTGKDLSVPCSRGIADENS